MEHNQIKTKNERSKMYKVIAILKNGTKVESEEIDQYDYACERADKVLRLFYEVEKVEVKEVK